MYMRHDAYTNTIQRILNVLCDPIGRSALAILWDGGEHCVSKLMDRLASSQNRMSRHVKVLRDAGLVIDRRDAQRGRNPDMAQEIMIAISTILNS
jgi:ArsR family transcriptional regulator